MGQRLDAETRTAKVRVELDNPDQKLKLEMFGTVRLPIQDPRVVPAIPETALLQIDGNGFRFHSNKTERVPKEGR